MDLATNQLNVCLCVTPSRWLTPSTTQSWWGVCKICNPFSVLQFCVVYNIIDIAQHTWYDRHAIALDFLRRLVSTATRPSSSTSSSSRPRLRPWCRPPPPRCHCSSPRSRTPSSGSCATRRTFHPCPRSLEEDSTLLLPTTDGGLGLTGTGLLVGLITLLAPMPHLIP